MMVGQVDEPWSRAKKACQQEHTSPVFSRLASFCTADRLSDVSLVASCGRRLACHRVVLAAASDLLAQLVTQGEGREVHCPDVDGDTMEAVLRFLYSSESPLTPENATAVLQAARKYGIAPLEALASAFLADELNVQNCCRLFARGESEGLQELRAQCLALAAERWDDVHQTEGFLDLTIDQLKAMLKTPELTGCKEVDLLHAACTWILRDISRVRHLEELLAMINFPQMSVEELQCVQQRLCLKYQQAQDAMEATQAGSKDTHMSDAHPATSNDQEPKMDAGSVAEPNGMAIKPEVIAARSQLEGLMGMLPLLLSLQAGKAGARQVEGSNGELSEKMDKASKVGRRQELLLAQVPQQMAGAPLCGSAVSQPQQQCKAAVAKGAMSGDATSQNSENQAQRQECSDVVSGTCGLQNNADAAKEAKSALQTPEMPIDIARAPATSLNPPRTARCVCQVDGCSNNLTGLRDYHVRYKICDYHLKVSSIMKDGCSQRFCQQCGRFHDLSEFDGSKRSCRSRLMRHNARRRKRLRTETEAFQGALQAARAAIPTMSPHHPLICLVSASPSTTGRGLEVPRSGALAGALLPQAEYLSVLPQVSQALAFAASTGTPMDSILINKLAAPVHQAVDNSLRVVQAAPATDTTAAMPKNDLARSLMGVEGVKEEGAQGVVH